MIEYGKIICEWRFIARNGWEWEKIAIKIEISIFYSWENDPMNGGLSSKPRVMKPEGNSLDLINKMGM
jgi:hypothetical protein